MNVTTFLDCWFLGCSYLLNSKTIISAAIAVKTRNRFGEEEDILDWYFVELRPASVKFKWTLSCISQHFHCLPVLLRGIFSICECWFSCVLRTCTLADVRARRIHPAVCENQMRTLATSTLNFSQLQFRADVCLDRAPRSLAGKSEQTRHHFSPTTYSQKGIQFNFKVFSFAHQAFVW